MLLPILDQLSRSSNKIMFLYNTRLNKFDYLGGPVEAMLHVDTEALKNNPELLFSKMHPEDLNLFNKVTHRLLEGKKSAFAFRIMMQDKTEKCIELEAYPVQNEEGREEMLAGTVEDVTEQKQYMNYLIEFGRKKNNMLEAVSHDLRGPLAIVRHMADLVQQDYLKSNNSEIENYIDIINRSCESCINLINELLAEEITASSTIPVNKQRIDVVAKVNEVIDLFKTVETLPHTFKVDTSSDTLLTEVDETKFTQILNNLISNAIKFTDANGEISIKVREEEKQFLLTVSDNGIGIPEALQSELFERHTKAARRGLQGEESKGIGLSIVKNLVEMQGGKIWFDSEVHSGTSFYIAFPHKN